MPGRLLGIFNRTSSKSDSVPKGPNLNQSDGGCSDSGKGPKKVSFDNKVKFKKFKLGRRQKAGERQGHHHPNREENHVVAYLFPGPFRSNSSRKSDGVATSSATNEFWINVNRRPTKPDDSGREPAALDSKEEEEKKSEISLEDSPPPSPPDRPIRRRRRRRSSPKMLHSPSTSNYNYDLDPSLHPSQQPSEMPRVKRNLVRNIVAQFNEEARKRDSYTSNENLSEIRTTSPNLIEATPENAPNQNRPFSYMVGNNGSLNSSSGSTTMGQRSKSEYNILQSPSDLIYAKVVVNGKSGPSGKSEGKYKTTVHTKVPNRSTTKFSSNTLGNSARTDGRSAQPPFDDSKKYFSKSMGNLLLDDGDRSSDHHQTAPKSKQNGKKTTDNSYYKFDAVDDEFVRQGGHAGGSVPNGRSKDVGRTNGHHREVSSSSSSVSRQQQRKTRRNSSGIESDEDDRRFPLLSHQSHSLSKFQDSANQVRKSSSPGQYETRNVEKWSENEVGPNSRKYTEHEYIHEVSMSGDDHHQRGDRVSKSQQDKSFWNSMERKGSKWTSDADLSGSASSLSKRSNTNKQRSRGSPPEDIRRIDDRDDVVLSGGRYRSPNRVLLRSRSGGDSDGVTIDRDVTTSPPLLSSPGYRKSTTIKEDSLQKTFTKTTPPPKSPPVGLSQYYFGQGESSPKVEGQQEDTRYTSESLHDSWRNHHHVTDLRKNSSQRRGSSDSGSGVGLLSSKLVKKANAEVNGGGGGKRNGLNYGSVEQLNDSRENVSGGRPRQQRLSETDSTNDKLSSPSWSTTNRSRNLGNDVVDTFSKYENESRQVTTPPNPLGGYTTEERRVIRKEETKRTTRREVRTTTPVSAGDDDDDQDEEKLFLEHHRQIHNEDKYSDTDRRSSSERRSGTLERKQNQEQQQQRHQQQHYQSKPKTYGHDSYWNDNNNKKIQDGKAERLFQKSPADRKIHVDIADQQNTTTTTNKQQRQRHHHHHHHASSHSERAFSDEMEDKMETSGSEPQLYSGSQDSRMSLGSHVSSAEEEEEDAGQRVNHHHQPGRATTEDIIAAHVNTPQSMVKQMNKQQISYENSQQSSSRDRQETTGGTSGRRFWFERTADEEEDIRRAHTRLDKQDINRNHYHDHRHQYNNKNNFNNNNNTWTSATMSRLESNKNRRNYQDEELLVNKVNTVDRRDRRHQRKAAAADIRLQVNDRDVVDIRNGHGVSDGKQRSSSVDRSPSFNSRVGSYHSENESQHSAGSSGSAKKRVNFKSRHNGGHKNGHSSSGNFGSRSDLSPMHREALLRSASPARAPSTSGSLKSNDSEASQGSSNKSVILHATAIADIPPAREYQYRSATISPTPPPSVIGGSSTTTATPGVSRETRTVQRSFSLLSPWKPRKYKEKYDKRSNVHKSSEHLENGHHHHEHDGRRTKREGTSASFEMESQQRTQAANHQARRETASSRGSSSEKLDSLPPLPSEEGAVSKSKNKKKSSGLLRRHSMPKDSRFANFFRRKKEAKK